MKVGQLLSQHQENLIIFLFLTSFPFYSHRFRPNKWWYPHLLRHPHPNSSSTQKAALLSWAPLYHRLEFSSYRWNTPPMLRLSIYHTLTYRFAKPKYGFHATHFYVCIFSKSFFFFSLDTQLSLPWVSPFFFHSSPLHAAHSCMTFSLGPMIQVLSCHLHSTQSTFTSSIRPLASLFCRYSTEQNNRSCVGGCMWVRCEVFGSCSVKCVHLSFKRLHRI